jgi:hypothetical protein
MKLYEFLDCATFEGTILIKAWNDDDCILEKFLDEIDERSPEIACFSWYVSYVYPITQYKRGTLVPCVVIEVSRYA